MKSNTLISIPKTISHAKCCLDVDTHLISYHYILLRQLPLIGR